MNKEIEQKYLEKIKDINKMIGLYKGKPYCCDNEVYHAKLDKLLCDLLKELGYEKIVKEYDKASEWFWYA